MPPALTLYAGGLSVKKMQCEAFAAATPMAERSRLNAPTIRSRLILEIASELVGGTERSIRVAEVRQRNLANEQALLPLDRMCRDLPDAPMGVPLHPAAERFWRAQGYLR